MTNLTLDVFWLTFMPMYQHIIGTITALLSFLAFYLMIAKTPDHGMPLARKLMFMQACILILDIVWGFLLCPIYLFPLSAFFCSGILCESRASKHIGTVLLFQCMAQVAMSVFITLHHKFAAISCMAKHRQLTRREKFVVRLSFCLLLEIPPVLRATSSSSMHDIRDFLVTKKQLALAALLDRNKNLHGVAYTMPVHFGIPIVIPIFASLFVTAIACSYFGCRTLALLSKKTSSAMSEKTRKMQQNLTYTLLLQLGIPLGIQMVPIVIGVLSQALFLFTPGFTNFVLCVQLCHASFHTIFLILTTPSYRHTVNDWLKKACEKRMYSRRGSIDPLRS